jgi:hypothetical protein
MAISFAQAAARTDAAMYNVDVVVPCPECREPVECTVHGASDVTIPECADPECAGKYRTHHITDAALLKASGERHELLLHLRDGGR